MSQLAAQEQEPAVADSSAVAVGASNSMYDGLAASPVPATDEMKSGKDLGQILKSLPYLFDDFMIIGGVNRSGLYYTKYYEELSHKTGFQVGVENYLPVFPKAFLHYGVYYSERGFKHDLYNIDFTTSNIEFPLMLSYDLPELESFDWRILLGAQFSNIIATRQDGTYPIDGMEENGIRYNTGDFRNFDWGFVFGLSLERNNVYVRSRLYTGFMKLVPQDQGMRSAFSLELGYFILRGLRDLR